MTHDPHFDAGHGGTDPGAVGLVHEEDVNLAIATLCGTAAKRQGWKPTQTRTEDRTIALGDRALAANRAGADAFVSIHADWKGAKGDGFAIITPRAHDKKDSLRLADAIFDELDPLTKYKDTAVYTDRRGLAVLNGTHMPACLVEVLSVGDAVLKDPKFRADVAEQIVQGLCAYYGTDYVAPGNTVKPKPTRRAYPGRVIAEGEKSKSVVKWVQARANAHIKALGIKVKPLVVDGDYGDLTRVAILKLRRAWFPGGKAEVGKVGRNTWRKLAGKAL